MPNKTSSGGHGKSGGHGGPSKGGAKSGGGHKSGGKGSSKGPIHPIAGGAKGKPGKDRETYSPPMHVEPLTQKHPDAHKEWQRFDHETVTLHYYRHSGSLYEVCLEIGGPTTMATWDQICEFVRDEEVGAA